MRFTPIYCALTLLNYSFFSILVKNKSTRIFGNAKFFSRRHGSIFRKKGKLKTFPILNRKEMYQLYLKISKINGKVNTIFISPETLTSYFDVKFFLTLLNYSFFSILVKNKSTRIFGNAKFFSRRHGSIFRKKGKLKTFPILNRKEMYQLYLKISKINGKVNTIFISPETLTSYFDVKLNKHNAGL